LEGGEKEKREGGGSAVCVRLPGKRGRKKRSDDWAKGGIKMQSSLEGEGREATQGRGAAGEKDLRAAVC